MEIKNRPPELVTFSTFVVLLLTALATLTNVYLIDKTGRTEGLMFFIPGVMLFLALPFSILNTAAVVFGAIRNRLLLPQTWSLRRKLSVTLGLVVSVANVLALVIASINTEIILVGGLVSIFALAYLASDTIFKRSA